MISAYIKKAIQKAAQISFEPDLTVPEVRGFGHYSTNIALRLAKERKENPLKLASEISTKIKEENPDLFESVDGVAPGFINLTLSPAFLQRELKIVAKEPLPKIAIGKGKKVIVDYCAVNIAKPMHVGHLRSTIIGDALANIHDALGYKTIRWNYIGDWGTQFGTLLAAYKMWGDRKKVESNPIAEMLALYVRFHDEMKTNAELASRGQQEFAKLEKGDSENRKLWEWFVAESMVEFEKMFSTLGVQFDTYKGEASYEKDQQKVLKELKNGIAKQSEGAWIIPLDEQKLPPALVEKSDGSTLYLTRDIASLKDRLTKKPAKILYVVANQQALHFEQLFAIANLLGLNTAELMHVKFGMVLGSDGKKFATREGRIVRLMDVINEGKKRALSVVEKKNPELSAEAKEKVASVVSIGALKYNDLKENRNSDIRFNWDQMLDLNGDTAPYLQYTYARLQSILTKAKSYKLKAKSLASLTGELELHLIKKMLDLPDIVVLCAKTYLTSHLAKYLYDFTKLINQYYETVHILSDENKDRQGARLFLIQAAAQTIKRGLGLLGIETLERI